MTDRKREYVRLLSQVASLHGTFDSVMSAVPEILCHRLTAAELAAVVDFGHEQARLGEARAMKVEGW